jgi:enoyl-CoA hydratase/carnithine racemase
VRRGGGGPTDSVRGLVLASDRPRFFSSGFDIREVFTYDRDGMAAFFGRFIDLYESLYRFPKPVVAALSGHTFAGGAILAISCDFRIMAEGDFGFALNEINLGLALTPTMRRMLVNAVGLAGAREVMLLGEPLTPAARSGNRPGAGTGARRTGPRPRHRLLARSLGAKPPIAYREIKRSIREFGGHDAAHTDRAALSQFLEARDARQAVCGSPRKRKRRAAWWHRGSERLIYAPLRLNGLGPVSTPVFGQASLAAGLWPFDLVGRRHAPPRGFSPAWANSAHLRWQGCQRGRQGRHAGARATPHNRN